MWEEMKRAYAEAGGPELSELIGKTIGMFARWSACTVVVVLTARAMGVGV